MPTINNAIEAAAFDVSSVSTAELKIHRDSSHKIANSPSRLCCQDPELIREGDKILCSYKYLMSTRHEELPAEKLNSRAAFSIFAPGDTRSDLPSTRTCQVHKVCVQTSNVWLRISTGMCDSLSHVLVSFLFGKRKDF